MLVKAGIGSAHRKDRHGSIAQDLRPRRTHRIQGAALRQLQPRLQARGGLGVVAAGAPAWPTLGDLPADFVND